MFPCSLFSALLSAGCQSWAGVPVEAPCDKLGRVEGLSPAVQARACQAVACAIRRQEVTPARWSVVTVVDFSLPSTAPRLWVLDLSTGAVLANERVSHGKNSGEDSPTLFSNTPDSNQSSLGVFRLAEPYLGKHGYSVRLDGLEPGFNDLARARDIVIHPASYNSDAHVARFGRLGRSSGCFTLPEDDAADTFARVAWGSLLIADYPDPAWIEGSSFLHC